MASAPVAEVTRLHVAAGSGNIARLQEYIAAGDDLNASGPRLGTPLACATAARQPGAVKVLLPPGCDPSKRDGDDFSPLYYAVENNDVAIAKLLIAAKADMDGLFGFVDGESLLEAADRMNNPKIAELLIEQDCDLERRIPGGPPPVVSCARRGNNETLNMLLLAGADVNESSKSGLTALHSAACYGHHEVVLNLLRRGANFDLVDQRGCKPLHNAADKGFDEIVKILLEAGCDVNSKDPRYLVTALHLACRSGYHRCAWHLICAGANISSKDCGGFAPLHNASELGHVEVIELLLASGAAVDIPDKLDRTPLQLTSLGGHVRATSLLIEAGAEPNRLNRYGMNALFVASNLQTTKVLLERGATATIIDNEGRSVLHYAGARCADAGCICALYKAGANPVVKDRAGETAADCVRKEGHEDAAKLLDLLASKYRAVHMA